MNLSRIIGAAGASALLLCPSSSNAFAAGASFSRPLDSISHATAVGTTQRQYTVTKLSASVANIGTEFPKATSVRPGESPVEEQDVLNPIDESCTILVVGSNRGIGIEFVKQCLGKGATVIATHRSIDVPASLSEIRSMDECFAENLITIQMDLEDEESIAEAARDLTNRKDVQSLTHIIHNAGIYLHGASFDGKARANRAAAPKVTKQVLMRTFAINSIAPLLVAQYFVPLLGKRSEKLFPVIAFLSSKVGSVDDNGSGGAYAYRSSKSALNNIAKSLSVDVADEARVVLLHPGWVRTDMTNGNGLIDTNTSVLGMLKAIEATDASTAFRFVDYKACQIPW
jgi:NAD(P)-dependent dehydrogenase (short-subunit alcohol dehydrogenase family)